MEKHRGWKNLILMAVATSIDALCGGRFAVLLAGGYDEYRSCDRIGDAGDLLCRCLYRSFGGRPVPKGLRNFGRYCADIDRDKNIVEHLHILYAVRRTRRQRWGLSGMQKTTLLDYPGKVATTVFFKRMRFQVSVLS